MMVQMHFHLQQIHWTKADGLISGGNQNYRTDRNYAWDTKWNVATQINEIILLLNSYTIQLIFL